MYTDEEQEIRMRAAIAERDRQRGRPLTEVEKLQNLFVGLSEHDSDCAGDPCTCGADRFKARLGAIKHTP